MARIEVEVRAVVRRLVVEVDDRSEIVLPPTVVAMRHRAPRPSEPLPEGPRRRRLAVAGGSLLVAAGLALGQAAARRRFGWPALPAPRVVGRLGPRAGRDVPALPAGGADPAI